MEHCRFPKFHLSLRRQAGLDDDADPVIAPARVGSSGGVNKRFGPATARAALMDLSHLPPNLDAMRVKAFLAAPMQAKRDRPLHRKGMAHPAFTVKMGPLEPTIYSAHAVGRPLWPRNALN